MTDEQGARPIVDLAQCLRELPKQTTLIPMRHDEADLPECARSGQDSLDNGRTRRSAYQVRREMIPLAIRTRGYHRHFDCLQAHLRRFGKNSDIQALQTLHLPILAVRINGARDVEDEICRKLKTRCHNKITDTKCAVRSPGAPNVGASLLANLTIQICDVRATANQSWFNGVDNGIHFYVRQITFREGHHDIVY